MVQLRLFRSPPAPESAPSRPVGRVGRTALFAAGAALAFAMVFLWRERRRSTLYRRQALAELRGLRRRIQSPETRPDALAALPRLVREASEALADPDILRTLSGQEWLQFLDSTWPGSSFSDGPGRVLPTLSYSNRAGLAAVSREQAVELVDLVQRWIREHRRPLQRMAKADSRS